MAIISKVLQLILTLALVTHQAKCELYTALVHMEQMIKVENVLINNLKNYVATQREDLNFVRGILTDFEASHEDALVNKTNYLANPLNAFLIVKRLASDFLDVETAMQSDTSDYEKMVQNISEYRNTLQFPTQDDLSGAALALLRIQKTYNLSVSDIANGDFLDKDNDKYQYHMSVDDCFSLGNMLHDNSDNDYAIQWYEEALKRVPPFDSHKNSKIYYKLVDATFEEENYVASLKYVKELMKQYPDDKELKEQKRDLTMKIKYSRPKEQPTKKTIETDPYSQFIKPITEDFYDQVQEEQYQKLCRRQIEPTPQQLAPLRCRYLSEHSPFTKLAPIKVEEVNLNPDIFIYHNIIYDKEIEALKELSESLIKTAQVYDEFTGQLRSSNTRVGKSVFIGDDRHKCLRDISARIEDMTGFRTKTAEPLQIVNYGIGGHYDPHVDFFPSSYAVSDNHDNRIGTVLFYMSDVKQGGGTVFPFTNTVVWPRKGTAAFWHNLYKSGDGDLRTKHGACPILSGSKWVANKWLHLKEQVTRPCALEKDHPTYMDNPQTVES